MTDSVSCRGCGATEAQGRAAVLSWVRDTAGWLCPRCARDHLRDIEAKLPDEWW